MQNFLAVVGDTSVLLLADMFETNEKECFRETVAK